MESKEIRQVASLEEEQLHVCYLQGVICGREFISEGKSFWITDSPDQVDDRHVLLDHLFTEGR